MPLKIMAPSSQMSTLQLLSTGNAFDKYRHPFTWLIELEIQSPCNGCLYSLTAWQRVREQVCRRRMLGGSTNEKPRKRPGRSFRPRPPIGRASQHSPPANLLYHSSQSSQQVQTSWLCISSSLAKIGCLYLSKAFLVDSEL